MRIAFAAVLVVLAVACGSSPKPAPVDPTGGSANPGATSAKPESGDCESPPCVSPNAPAEKSDCSDGEVC